VGIISANVSSFGTFKKQYERFIEKADVFLLQEHRLLDHPTRNHSETVASAKHWLKARGLAFIFPPARDQELVFGWNCYHLEAARCCFSCA
jgi:hypothetical protein